MSHPFRSAGGQLTVQVHHDHSFTVTTDRRASASRRLTLFTANAVNGTTTRGPLDLPAAIGLPLPSLLVEPPARLNAAHEGISASGQTSGTQHSGGQRVDGTHNQTARRTRGVERDAT
jgi:hypothetical protein